MSVSVRLLTFAALVASVACKDTTKAEPFPSRAALNGYWQCAQAQVWYHNLVRDVREWRQGSCVNYLNITSPPRTDSVEVQTFRIDDSNRISRIDFMGGTIAYDSTTGLLQAIYPGGHVDTYQATSAGLTTRLPAWDYTGDGEPDSLILTYWKVP